MKPILFSLALFILALDASAMDRWTALSMIESGDNDYAVGAAGEVSRYQIKPEFWHGGDPSDASTALATARQIMRARVQAFQRIHGRAPNDYEFYILWNAPGQVDRPRAVVGERARRFENLIKVSDSRQYAALWTPSRQN
ncbi:MAG TPA: hypothetical protein VHG89_13410 [Verrucomicrobiae bacterium]|nr:hypothetical protein [Verrucomicrobiae bacterium]